VQTVYNPNGVPIQTAFNGYLLGSRTKITATGSSTYTPPVGCKYLFFEAIAGGAGGGAAANSTAAQITLASGGGAGSYSSAWTAVQPTFAVSVGTGGASAGNGNATTVTYPTAIGTQVVVNTTGGGQGAAIATGTTELFAAPAGPNAGGNSGNLRVGQSPGYAGHRVSGTVGRSGQGAHGPWGGGGAAVKAQGAGGAATNYGSGGGGGMSVNAGGAAAGGVGFQGLVIISEYY
jgi:hypothetical protein